MSIKIAKDFRLGRGSLFAKTAWMAAGCLVAAAPSLAQERTGVSLPMPVATISPDDQPAPVAKPSAAVPLPAAPDAAQSAPAKTVYGPYVPYRAAQTPAATTSTAAAAAPFDPDANIVTTATAGLADRRLLSGPDSATVKADLNAGIVTHIPSLPGEIPDGTLVKVRLREELSTLTTKPGTKFSAELSEPVLRDGRVVIPEGAVLQGHVTWVRGGKRIGGPAAIHLEPQTVTMPDGSLYILSARAIDTNSWMNTKVDSEGTILRDDSPRHNGGAMALTAAGGAAAGAMIAGVPGALIGAGVGAGVSTVVWLRQDRQAVLPKDLGIVFSLTEPMMVKPANAVVAPLAAKGTGGE